MRTEIVLWGVPAGEPEWAEDIITVQPDTPAGRANIAKAKVWAIGKRMTGIRQSVNDGTPPDFAATVRAAK